MCLAILAHTHEAAQAVRTANIIDPPLLNSALAIVAPSPPIMGLAQPVASALLQDLMVTTLSSTLPSISSLTINPAETLLNHSDHNIGDITDVEFQALLHMAPPSGGSVHGGDEMDTV
jgi:hypothetical protein